MGNGLHFIRAECMSSRDFIFTSLLDVYFTKKGLKNVMNKLKTAENQ